MSDQQKGVETQQLEAAPEPTKKIPLSNAQRQARHKEKKKQKGLAESYVYSSKTEPTESEAKQLLELRGLKNPHVIDTAYDLALNAAEQTGITPNRFYFQNGIAKTLASYAQKTPQLLEAIPDEAVLGELSNRAELVCLHDFSIAWREDAVDFTEFLRLRRLCKTDAFELGKILDKDFEECCQGEWAKFLPRFNPDTLPPNYNQRQMRQWLEDAEEVKDYLLMASRNSMKSSFALVWALTLHLCCPDARLLLVSETKKLSAAFIRGYRNYWEIKPNNETKMQILFPEYCIATGEGSEQTFESPMAHLDLIAGSARAASYESSEVGGRADVIIHDDPISNLTVGTETQITKSIATYDLLQKLREVLGSITLVIGTPWHEQDLYATLLKRAADEKEADGTVSFASRIDPIVTVKTSARHKLTAALLPTLTPEDIESYLLPVRMPWRFVKKEIAANPTFALSQNFCIFPVAADSDMKVQFDEDELRNHVRQVGFFEGVSQTVMSFDRAYSVSRYADFSCLVVGKIMQRERKTICVIADVIMDRWRESEIVENILRAIEKYQPRSFVCEKDKSWEDLWAAIRKGALLRGIALPHFIWKDIDTSPRSMAKRVKRLELPISDGRVWWVSSLWNDPVFTQFIKFDGIHDSNSHRKDDACSAVSLLYDTFMPRTEIENDETDPKELEQRKRAEEIAQQQENLRLQHQRMFGPQTLQTKTDEPPPSPPQDPRRALLGKILPPGMRV